MKNYNEDKDLNTWEEVFYDYLQSPGWNSVRLGFRGIEYTLSPGDWLEYTDRDGKEHVLKFTPNVEEMLDAHILEDGLSLRDIMRRDDLDFFAMD